MIVTLENTTKVVELNGIPARVWEGTTESGTKIIAFITRISIPEDASAEVKQQFEKELTQTKPPSAEIQAIPLKLII